MIRKAGFPLLSKTFDTKVEAEAWANEKEAEMFRGSFVDRRPLERTTLLDILDQYEREVTSKKKGVVQEENNSRG